KVSISGSRLEEAAKRMEEAGKKLEKAQASNDPAAIAEASGNALAAAFGMVGGDSSVKPIPAERLQALLPEKLGSFRRSSLSSEDGAALGIATSRVDADYEDGDRRLRVEIVDLGGAAALAG